MAFPVLPVCKGSLIGVLIVFSLLFVKALMDILQQDRRESAEQRQELCDIITKLQGELQSTEEQRDKVVTNQLLSCLIYYQSLRF